jgi:hypothetical protein
MKKLVDAQFLRTMDWFFNVSVKKPRTIMAFDATYYGANALLVHVWLDGIDSAYAKDGFSAGGGSAANVNTRLLFTLSAS